MGVLPGTSYNSFTRTRQSSSAGSQTAPHSAHCGIPATPSTFAGASLRRLTVWAPEPF